MLGAWAKLKTLERRRDRMLLPTTHKLEVPLFFFFFSSSSSFFLSAQVKSLTFSFAHATSANNFTGDNELCLHDVYTRPSKRLLSLLRPELADKGHILLEWGLFSTWTPTVNTTTKYFPVSCSVQVLTQSVLGAGTPTT